MKIEAKALKSALDVVMPYVVPNSTLPILSHIKMEASGDSLKLTASCVDAQIEHTVPASDDEFSMCVNAAALKQFAQFCTDDTSIVLKGEKIDLKSGSMKARLSTLDSSLFPIIAKSEKIIAELEWPALCERVNFAAAFTAKNDIRPYARCVHIQASGTDVDVLGTNGMRMGFATFPHITPAFSISIDGVSVRRMTPEFVSLVVREEQIELRNENSVALLKLATCNKLDGRRMLNNFPLPNTGEIGRKSLAEAASFAASFHDGKLRCVVRFESGEQNVLRLVSHSNDAEAPFSFTGAAFSNTAYATDLIDAMKALDGDQVRMEYNAEEMNKTPMRFASGDKQILIMPLRA